MKTTASPAETWAIVIVAVICLAFWLVMVVAIAPRPDPRKRQREQARPVPLAGGTPVPVAGGMHAAAAGPGTEQTRDDLPSVPGQRQPAPPPRTPIPAQRESATDQPAPGRRPDR